MGPGQVYQSLQKGTLDGATMGWDGIRGFRLGDVVKSYFEARFGVLCFHVVMNKKKYDSLSGDIRKVIDTTTAKWIDTFPKHWDKADMLGEKYAKAKHVKGVNVTDAQRASWRKRLKPVIDQLIARAEKQGVSNAHEIYDEMVKRAAQYQQ